MQGIVQKNLLTCKVGFHYVQKIHVLTFCAARNMSENIKNLKLQSNFAPKEITVQKESVTFKTTTFGRRRSSSGGDQQHRVVYHTGFCWLENQSTHLN